MTEARILRTLVCAFPTFPDRGALNAATVLLVRAVDADGRAARLTSAQDLREASTLGVLSGADRGPDQLTFVAN